jgi:hypothetical protein
MTELTTREAILSLFIAITAWHGGFLPRHTSTTLQRALLEIYDLHVTTRRINQILKDLNHTGEITSTQTELSFSLRSILYRATGPVQSITVRKWKRAAPSSKPPPAGSP